MYSILVSCYFDIAARFGDMAFEYFDSLMKGTAPVRAPAQGRPVPEWYNNEARFGKAKTRFNKYPTSIF